MSNPYVTLYSYDALNNLLQVQQKGGTADSTQWRVRGFQYDSLSRLTQSTNPETGVISFTYDNDGLLKTKTSPLPNHTGASTVTITYAYDELHRHTGRTYSNGDPAISYGYDAPDGSLVNGLTVHNGIGRRTSMTDGSGSAAFSYDSEGRISSESKNIGTTSPISKNVSYTYNLDGSLATIVYPSGSTITYTPAQNGGSAGREGMVQDLAHGINYVTGATGPGSYATYAPDGSIATFNNGYAAGFSGISNTFSYNSRLQPATIQAVSPGATVFSIGYDFHLGSGDNGNVYQVTNYKDNSRSQIFTYDQLNRLSSGKTSASTLWGDNYTYDPWGNLTQKTPMAGAQQAENFSQTVLSNNRIASLAYDAAGNTTNDGVNSYTYDEENQIVSAAGVTYTYDGDGARVKKSNGRLYWYGAPGIVAESDLSGNLTAEYIFFDGERVARRDLPSGAVHYYFSDHLKSVSVVTSAAGVIEEESDYHPWGEERIITHTLADQHFKFNGKERDAETGFDEFGARLYNSAWGRWLTPDWSADPTPVPYAQMDNPQSLNLYEYALNNPTTFPDLDGHLAAGGSAVSGSGGFSADCGYACESGGGELNEWLAKTRAEFSSMKAAAVAGSHTAMDEIDKLVRPLVNSAEGALEDTVVVAEQGGKLVLKTAGGAILFVLSAEQKTATDAQDRIHLPSSSPTQGAPEPQTGSGGARQGGGKGKKPHGNLKTSPYAGALCQV